MNKSLQLYSKKLIVPFLLIVLFGLGTKNVFAQHQYDNWYFGSNAGMNFTAGSPVSLTDGQVNTTEGSSCISDNAGNLLFYTDGVTVWNKLHMMMVNGDNLHGGLSSSQSALIIPQPGSDSLYYIFTTGESLSYGLQYSVVDMSLQGGEGEVILKNVNLINNTTEKLTAVRHSNNTDYWVITHIANSSEFDAFQFTSAGVNTTAVASNTGTVETSEIGYMKSSHNGSKIVVAVHSPDYFFELFDFDNSTGTVSNPIYLMPPVSSSGPYGVEFSANDSILYGTMYTPATLLQWDISSNDASLINASLLSIANSSNTYIGGIGLASDGKIYVTKYFDYYLGVINDPNVYGTGCNYNDNGFNLFPKQSELGLPNFVPGGVQQILSPFSNFAAADSSICQKFCLDFFDESTNDPTAWEWLFPGGAPSSSTDQNPTSICYNNPGTYDVTLITTNSYGSDTLTMSNFLTVNPTPPFPVISQNGYVLTSTPALSYQWQFNSIDIAGATNQSYAVTQTGLYTVIITDENGCTSSASQYVGITGIEDPFSEEEVSTYPNPSDGNFMVEWVNGLMVDEIKIEVVNTLGQIILSSVEKNNNGHFSKIIDGTALSPGVYFIELSAWVPSESKKVFYTAKKITIVK